MWKRKRKICGEFPDFGAIFMSNRTTFRDCLNSKLFGLPSSQSHFVKQVRAGMILFLFENEERELHGVFQATSDGQMNIMPRAYESSGKLFPAQVQCTRIWECDPLGESEFRDAIEENYYETNKFNFGLSQHQVRRLLCLFNSKKKEVGTSKSLSCGRRRRLNYQCGDGEMENKGSTFRRVLSSGKSVVKLEEPGSSPCDYSDKVYGSGSLDVSGISCSSGGCNAGSNDFGSGSGADVSEEKPEILEESSKDVSTELGDFIPLPSPEQSDCEVECVGDKKSSSVKLYLPLKLLSSEDLGQVNMDVQFAAPSWDGYSGHPSIELLSGVSPPLRTSDCHLKEGSQNSRKVKGLYSDAQGEKTSVFSRLRLSPSIVFQKAIGDLQQSKGKRRNTNSLMSKAFEVTRDNDEKVKSQIGSDQHKKTTKEAEFTLRDGKDASEYKQLAREYTGGKEEKTRGHDSVQDIMDLLLQRHGTWRKFNARTNSFRQKNVDPTVKKSVFSRLSRVPISDARDTIVMIRSKKVNDNGNKTVRKARIYVPEKEGHEKENKTKEQLPATLQQNGHWKRTRQSEVPNPNHEDEKDSEKSTNMGIMLKKQDQTIGDSESKCKFEQGHRKKVARPLFDKSSEVKTFTWENSGSVQVSSEESSAEKKANSGSCEAPTTGKTADGKTDSSHDEEVQPVIYPLQCHGNKGEASCNSAEKKSKLELLIDQFNAGKAETACNLVEEEPELELLVGQFNAYKGEAACNMVENESKLELRVGQFNADKGEAACNLVEESKLELLLGKFNADGGIVTTPLKTYVRRRQKAYVYSTSPV